jgi:hypothetical protein
MTSVFHQESHTPSQSENCAGSVEVDAADSQPESLAHTQPEQSKHTTESSPAVAAAVSEPQQQESDLQAIGIHLPSGTGDFLLPSSASMHGVNSQKN